MKTLQQTAGSLKGRKRMILVSLYLLAGAIALSGTLFGAYSAASGVTFPVLNTRVPGMVLGVIVLYFGVRSIFSVSKLRAELAREDAVFSWGNFKREKKAKSR
jgi:hypothetical protein